MSIICEFCSVSVKTKYNLKSHLINNKNCLKKRGVKLDSNFICNGCNFIFTNNTNLTTHKHICKKYIILKIKEELDEKIKEDKDKYEKENKIKFDIQLRSQKDEYEIKIEDLTNKLKNVDLEKKDLITQHELKIIDMKYNYEKIIKDIQSQNDKLLGNLQKLVNQVIDRPTTSILTNNIIEEKLTSDDIKEYKFGNNFIVPIRSDGMINATSLCKAAGKRLDHYKENLQTKEYLDELSLVTGIPVTNLFQGNIGGHSGTWVHRKVGYHLAQWISPKFAVQVSLILDELFITGKVELKQPDEIDNEYKSQITTLKTKLDTNTEQYQKLLNKHNSSLKTHRYIKFKKTDPCFYIIDSGIDCDCLRYKFGITGLDQGNNIDDRLRCHRTLWPQLKVRYLLFIKDVEMIEKSFKMMFGKEINPNGHEIIEGVTFDEMIERIEKLFDILCIKEYHIMTEEKLKEYNDYVETTIKQI
jgi:hypothetical protein